MRILFDHQVFSWQTYGGVSRYFVEQMRGLQALGQDVLLPEHFFSENVYLRTLPGFQRKNWTRINFKGKKILQNWLGRPASLAAIRQFKPTVFHPTYFDPYFLKALRQQGIPFVLTVHDMIHEIYGHGKKGLFSLDANVVTHKRLLAREAAAVIAVSENTRKDFLHFCPEVDPSKVFVIHHGISESLIRSEAKTHGGYLLFVGQRKAYKNFDGMLESLAPLLRERKELSLICVGGSEFDADEQARMTHLGVSGQVVYKSVHSDDALADLYAGAACFIFPSRYEGFGIPVLEAFACGCPAVLNQASSLPEVGGNAAMYFNDDKPDSLDLAVRRILEDESFRQGLIRKGRLRVQEFTWAQSVEKHLAAYQAVANNSI